MGDELLTAAAPPKLSEPFANKAGFAIGCGLRAPISTSISEGGLGGVCQTSFIMAENFDERYKLTLSLPFGATEQKLFPTTDAEGTTAEHKHWALQFGYGKSSRAFSSFNDAGDFRFSLNLDTTPLIGGGKSTISRADYELDGETFEFEDTSETTWDLGTQYALMGEIRPGGRGPVFELGPMFYYGIQYGGENSEFNRVKLELQLMLTVGYGDASTISGTDADTEMGAMGIVQDIYGLGQGLLQGYFFNKTISQPMEALDDYGLLDDTGAEDRGSMSDVPLLSAAASIMGGPSLTPPLKAGKGWFWGLTALRAVGGGLNLAMDSTDSKGSGVGNLLGVGRLLSYAIADIEAPSDRLAKDEKEVQDREMYINVAWYLANAAIFLIGAAADSDIAMIGGASANNSLAMSPDPIDRGMVEETMYGWMPVTGYWGKEIDGNRGGIYIQNDWRNLPVYTSLRLAGPTMTPNNWNNAVQEKPYSSIMAPTDVVTSAGLVFDWHYFELLFGPEFGMGFGGKGGTNATVGALTGLSVEIPFNGQPDGAGLSLGARFSAHKIFSDVEGDYGLELMPVIGAKF